MGKNRTDKEHQVALAKRRHKVELRKKRKRKGQTGQPSQYDYNGFPTPNIQAMFKKGKK